MVTKAATRLSGSEDGAGVPAHEQVYRAVRDRVLFGDFAPGQPVTIQGLVDEMGAGMTPVREALRRLTSEGALQALGNRRITVPELTKCAVEELLVARLALEPELTRRASGRVSSGDIAALAAMDERVDAAIARGDVPAYLRGNHAFHAYLNGLADAPILNALVAGLWLRFGPSLRVVCGQVGTRALPDRHKEVLAALRARDAQGAAQAMAEDVRQGMALIADALPDVAATSGTDFENDSGNASA